MATIKIVARSATQDATGHTVDEDLLATTETTSAWVVHVAAAVQALHDFGNKLTAQGQGERSGNGLLLRVCWPANVRTPRGWTEAEQGGRLEKFFPYAAKATPL